VEKRRPFPLVLSMFRQVLLTGMLALALAPASRASQETRPTAPFSSREQFRGALRFLAPQQQHRSAAAFRTASRRRGNVRFVHTGLSRRRPPYAPYGYPGYGYPAYGYPGYGYPEYGYRAYGYRAYGYPPWAYPPPGYPGYGGFVAVSPYDPYRDYRRIYYDGHYPYGYPGY
jgi:hypothetical protein